MLGESIGPVFWHLDGCNNDQDFPFSIFCRTRQEWEEEQRGYEEFNPKFDAEQKCKQAVLEGELPGSETSGCPSIWTRSLSNPDASEDSPWVRVFGLGCHVAELVSDLKAPPGAAAFAESLGRCFGNLRDAIENPSGALLEPVVERFCQELDAAAEARVDLAPKCADLEHQLREFAKMMSGDQSDI
jgi:hypothetical protein